MEGLQDIRGWTLFDRDNNGVGTVDDLVVNVRTGDVPFIIADIGGALGIGAKKTLLPLDRLRLQPDRREVLADAPADRFKSAPDYSDRTESFDQFNEYWAEKAPERKEQREHKATEKRERKKPQQRKKTESRGRAAERASEREKERAGERVIPEVEERLEVKKHEEKVGEVEVRKEVETHPETVREKVKRTRVYVSRRDVEPGRKTKPGEKTLRGGETIRIPVVEERLFVEKKAEVVGEVVIRTEIVEEEQEVTENVRRERVDIQSSGDVDESELQEEEEPRRLSKHSRR